MITSTRIIRRGVIPIAGIVTAMALALAGCGGSANGASGSKRLVWMVVGGVRFQALQKYVIDPFEKQTGITVTAINTVDWSQIKTMVDEHKTSVDLVSWSGDAAVEYCNTLLQPITNAEVNRAQFAKQYNVSPCGVPESSYIHTAYYLKSAFPKDPPSSWADFFNTKKYPGKRAVNNDGTGSNFEAALLADGVSPSHLYPLDLSRALQKWSSIKNDVVFWSQPAQLTQMMQSKSYPIVYGWGPAATETIVQGADYVPFAMDDPIGFDNQTMLVKGAPDKANAIKFLNFKSQASIQAAFSENYPEMPTNASVHVTNYANKVLQEYGPTAPMYSDVVEVNDAWRSKNLTKMADLWNNWVSGS